MKPDQDFWIRVLNSLPDEASDRALLQCVEALMLRLIQKSETDPVKEMGRRFQAELLKGPAGRYPDLADTISQIRQREVESRPPNEAALRGFQ